MTTPALNKALAKAIAKARTIIEDRKVQSSGGSFGGYGYASAEAIIEEARNVLVEHDLVVYPSAFEVRLTDTVELYPLGGVLGDAKNQPTVPMVQTKQVKHAPKIMRKYVLAHSSGEEREFTQEAGIYADDKKSADKWINSGDTTSLAYFLRNLLLLPRLSKEEYLERERLEKERDAFENPGAPMKSAPAAPAQQKSTAAPAPAAAPAAAPTPAAQAAAHAANLAAMEKDLAAKAAASKPAAPPAAAPPAAAPAAKPAPAAAPAAPKPAAAPDPKLGDHQDKFAKLVGQLVAYHTEQGVTVADFETALNKAGGGVDFIRAGKFLGRGALTEVLMSTIEGQIVAAKDKAGKATFGLSTLIPAGAAA